MLKSVNTALLLDDLLEQKCAEILFGKKHNFSIICTQCDLKLFEYTEFTTHFSNVHLTSVGVEQSTNVSPSNEVLPQNETCRLDVEVSDNEDMFPSPPRIIHTLQESFQSNAPGSPVSFNSDILPSFGSDEEYTPIILKTNRQKQKAKLNSTKGKYECLECSVTYMFPRNLDRHMNKYHNTNGYKCQDCDQIYNSYNELQDHKRQNHIVLFNCSECDRTFKTKKSLKYHAQSHTAERNIYCDVPGCSKAFASDARLRDHKRIIHFTKPNFVCEVCGSAYKRHNDLVIHRRAHTGEKPYQCNICKKSFSSNSLLNEHKPMHSTERPHVCDVCGKAFSRPKALYHHKHLHLGVKKFVCKLCGHAYAQMAGLSAHMRQHKQQEFCLD